LFYNVILYAIKIKIKDNSKFFLLKRPILYFFLSIGYLKELTKLALFGNGYLIER
jgi:hypothetical protein